MSCGLFGDIHSHVGRIRGPKPRPTAEHLERQIRLEVWRGFVEEFNRCQASQTNPRPAFEQALDEYRELTELAKAWL